MKFITSAVAIAFIVSGCSVAGHGGAITDGGGLQATCAGGCAEYRADGTGCAKFHKNTAESCAAYFDKLCERNPKQCSNK